MLGVWLAQNPNHLANYLEDLKVRLPMLLLEVLEKNPMALIVGFALLHIDMANLLLHVALERLPWVTIGNVDIDLILTAFIYGTFGP